MSVQTKDRCGRVLYVVVLGAFVLAAAAMWVVGAKDTPYVAEIRRALPR